MKWVVPVSLGFPNGESRLEMLHANESTFDVPETADWIKVNFGEIAPIRVHYEDPSSLIKNGLPTLSVVDQVGILSDTRALARAGRLGLTEVITTIKSFKTTNADVWDGIESTIFNIEKIVDAVGQMDRLEELVSLMVLPEIEKIGWSNRPSDTDNDKRFRASLFKLASSFACTVQSGSNFRIEAIKKTSGFIQNVSESTIPDDIRASVFSAALSAVENTDGGKSLWQSLKDLAESTDIDQGLRLDLYAALGSVRDVSCKKETLEFALSEKVKIQDFFYPIGSVRRSKDGSEIAWKWINANFDKCRKRVEKANPSLLAAVIRESCAGSVSETRASEIEARFGDIEAVKRNVAQLVEGIRSNSEYVKRNLAVKL
jgi:hypothetical protein